MQLPTATDLVALWEQGEELQAVNRALLLLSMAQPGLGTAQLGALSVGQQNKHLLEIQIALFGTQVRAYDECSDCSERLEFTVDLSAFRSPSSPEQVPLAVNVSLDGYEVTAIAPTGADLAAIAGSCGVAEAAASLVERCILEAHHGDQKVTAIELPKTVIGLLADTLAQTDPLALIEIHLRCPECGHLWTAVLDLTRIIWAKLDGRVRRLLWEVDVLAKAYGWSEAEILGLTPKRREAYLRLVLA